VRARRARPTGTDFVLHEHLPGLRRAGEQSLGTAITALASGAFVAVGGGVATGGADVTTHARAWWSNDAASWPIGARCSSASLTLTRAATVVGPR